MLLVLKLEERIELNEQGIRLVVDSVTVILSNCWGLGGLGHSGCVHDWLKHRLGS